MSAEARVAQASRDTASELLGIGTTHTDWIAKAFEHLADFVDGREPSPDGAGDTRRQRARKAVVDIICHYGWTTPSVDDLVIDAIIDAVDLA